MKQIQHIVFDIGQLLIHWDPELIYLDLIPDPKERLRFLTEICSPGWNVEQDRGRDWAEAENLLIDAHPEHRDHIRAFRKFWIKSIPYAYTDVVDLFAALINAGRDVTLLTNFNQHTYVEARSKFGFLNAARGATVSGDVGMIKPEPDIFAHHGETFGLDPMAILFIDDSAANIAAAGSAGWRGIHFAGRDGAPILHGALHQYGVAM